MATLATNLNQFSMKLYGKMSAGENANFFISPFSISAALSMCLAGARGETQTELKQLLCLSDFSDEQIHAMNSAFLASLVNLGDGVALNTANRIFPNKGFEVKDDFRQVLDKHFNSSTHQLDFNQAEASAAVINNWVAEQTKDKIKDLVPASMLDAFTRLVLVNAIYFKGSWAEKFDVTQTTKEDFHLEDGSTQKVDMMSLTNKKFKLQIRPNGLNARTCEFPYAGKSVSMTIILPNESIAEVEKQLLEMNFADVLGDFEETGKVFAYIPKFKLEYQSELSDHVKGLGVNLAFDQAKADFKGISDLSTGLFISKIIHKAVVEVNEEGTEAAAATAVVMMTRCAVMEFPPEKFRCDKPFLFVIHEKKTNAILFMGKYMKPV